MFIYLMLPYNEDPRADGLINPMWLALCSSQQKRTKTDLGSARFIFSTQPLVNILSIIRGKTKFASNFYQSLMA